MPGKQVLHAVWCVYIYYTASILKETGKCNIHSFVYKACIFYPLPILLVVL